MTENNNKETFVNTQDEQNANTIDNILQTLDLKLGEHRDIEATNDNETIDITQIDGFSNLSDEQKLTLLSYPQQNGVTFFYNAFSDNDVDIITNLVNALNNDQLKKALEVQNDAGFTAVDGINSKDQLETVLNAVKDEEKKKTILATQGYEGQTLLHVLVEDQDGDNSDLVNYIFEQAKTLGNLAELLKLKNTNGDSPVHLAFNNQNEQFINKVLEQEGGVLADVFKDQGENHISVVQLALDNNLLVNEVLTKLDGLEAGDIKDILNIELDSGEKTIQKLFAVKDFLDKFQNNEEAVADCALENYDDLVQNNDDIVSEKVQKFSSVFEAASEAGRKALTNKISDFTDGEIGNKFPSNAIKAKVEALVNEKCKDEYRSIEEAKDCVDEINKYTEDSAVQAVKDAVGKNLGKFKSTAEEYISKNEVKSEDILPGVNYAFQMVKHQLSLNKVTTLAKQDDEITKEQKAAAQTMFKLQSGVVQSKDGEKVKSLEEKDVTTAKIFAASSGLMTAKLQLFLDKIKNNNSTIKSSLEKNIKAYKEGACVKFSLTQQGDKSCAEEHILKAVNDNFCNKLNENDFISYKDSNADKLLCATGDNALTADNLGALDSFDGYDLA